MNNAKSCGNMPQVTFSAFIISLASSALVGLGEAPDPGTGVVSANPGFARHNIDVLEMLRQKTSGGLELDESRLLESLLYELRIKYVLLCESLKRDQPQ